MSRQRPSSERWIVDDVRHSVAVLVLADEVEEVVVSEVAADLLGDRAEPGTVLEVPLGDVGEPVWERAVRVDEAERGPMPEDES
jgi:hypothetical protein